MSPCSSSFHFSILTTLVSKPFLESECLVAKCDGAMDIVYLYSRIVQLFGYVKMGHILES